MIRASPLPAAVAQVLLRAADRGIGAVLPCASGAGHTSTIPQRHGLRHGRCPRGAVAHLWQRRHRAAAGRAEDMRSQRDGPAGGAVDMRVSRVHRLPTGTCAHTVDLTDSLARGWIDSDSVRLIAGGVCDEQSLAAAVRPLSVHRVHTQNVAARHARAAHVPHLPRGVHLLPVVVVSAVPLTHAIYYAYRRSTTTASPPSPRCPAASVSSSMARTPALPRGGPLSRRRVGLA